MKQPEDKLTKINLQVPQELKDTLLAEAKKQHISLSAYVRIVLYKHLSEGVE